MGGQWEEMLTGLVLSIIVFSSFPSRTVDQRLREGWEQDSLGVPWLRLAFMCS